GGRQEIIQLWINSPAKNKMDQPHYYPLTKDETPTLSSDDGLTTIHVIAGELDNIKGPMLTLSPVNTFTVEMKKGAEYFFTLPLTHNAFIYVLDGKLNINAQHVINGKYAAMFNNDGTGFELEALEDSRLFLGSVEPLNEVVASHGPFVMN